MPTIKSSADLRNGYNDISTFCHTYDEPVFITKNGKGDLAVLSIESYEKLVGKFELYGLVKEGLDDVKNGDTRPFSDAIADARAKRKRRKMA
jgi:PHD/YefM family antitoxin component YafN of YafNO toxin-antitoxin module